VDELASIGALAEPTRRALYEHVVAAGGWVGRDAAADAVGVERGTAAHHLDRLASDGLLEVDYRRLTGRTGPGAGRPAKLYRRARRDFEITLPPRDYELAGRLLAEAADRARHEGTPIDAALDDVAREEGHRLGGRIRDRLAALRSGTVRRRRRRLAAVLDALAAEGYEPRLVDGTLVVLANCPFHRLAREHTELICGMNHRLLAAAIEESGASGIDVRLEPADDTCCVRLHTAATATDDDAR
jgi:predicted ArsR family transcriptional regulator